MARRTRYGSMRPRPSGPSSMGRGCATVEIKINYFRPVQSGRVIARGWKRELTRSLGYAEGEVVNEEGKVLARATGTFFLTKSMRQDDRERV